MVAEGPLKLSDSMLQNSQPYASMHESLYSHIRIQSPLKEPRDLSGVGSLFRFLLNPDGFLLEQVDDYRLVSIAEQTRSHVTSITKFPWNERTSFSNNLTLLLWLRHPLEATEEEINAINDREVDAKMFLQRLLHLLAFVETHQSYKKYQCRLGSRVISGSYRCR